MKDITIVTAASSNHFLSLLQFLDTIPTTIRVVVYDIGLTPEQFGKVTRGHIRKFDFDKYPEFVRLTSPDAGAYAWKPIIVYDICNEFGGIVIWCDSGNKIYDISSIIQATEMCGVYSSISAGTYQEWTHPTTRALLRGFETNTMRNASCIGINWSSSIAQYLIHDWKMFALRKELSIPDGANRNNHRHDQSILTFLIYAYNLPRIDEKVGYTIHNDID